MICNDIITGKSGIYKITNLINGKIYIGRSLDLKSRKSKHKTTKTNTLISRAIHKYGHDNFLFEVIEYCEPQTFILIDREKYYLEKLNPFNDKGYNLLKDSNIGGWYGMTHSVESKELMSKSKKGIVPWNKGKTGVQKHGSETRKLMSQNNSGKRNPFYGKTHSIESKNKISKANKGRDHSHEYKPVLQIDKNTNEVIKVWESISKVYKFLGVKPWSSSISRVCKGKQKTAYGFKWSYLT